MKQTCEVEPRPKTLKGLLVSKWFWKTFTAMVIGGILGYLYHHYAGESIGTSTFTRTPVISILSGAFLGVFFVNRPCKTC